MQLVLTVGKLTPIHIHGSSGSTGIPTAPSKGNRTRLLALLLEHSLATLSLLFTPNTCRAWGRGADSPNTHLQRMPVLVSQLFRGEEAQCPPIASPQLPAQAVPPQRVVQQHRTLLPWLQLLLTPQGLPQVLPQQVLLFREEVRPAQMALSITLGSLWLLQAGGLLGDGSESLCGCQGTTWPLRYGASLPTMSLDERKSGTTSPSSIFSSYVSSLAPGLLHGPPAIPLNPAKKALEAGAQRLAEARVTPTTALRGMTVPTLLSAASCFSIASITCLYSSLLSGSFCHLQTAPSASRKEQGEMERGTCPSIMLICNPVEIPSHLLPQGNQCSRERCSALPSCSSAKEVSDPEKCPCCIGRSQVPSCWHSQSHAWGNSPGNSAPHPVENTHLTAQP